MARYKLEYGPTAPIPITIASLANGSMRASSGIVNTSGYTDILVSFRIRSASASTDAAGSAVLYAFGSTNLGAYYTEGATGSDAALTPKSPTNLMRLGFAHINTNSTTYDIGPFSLASAFDGTLPNHVGVAILNATGAAFDSSVASGWYQGVLYQEG